MKRVASHCVSLPDLFLLLLRLLGGFTNPTLQVRNETELDARIAELEDKMMHGTIDLRTEKQYVREIKTLQATREELKSMNEQKGALEGSKVYQEELRDTLNILSEELKVLRGQEEMLKKVFEKTREPEQVWKKKALMLVNWKFRNSRVYITMNMYNI